jgi:hypothetical protein
MSRVTIKDVDYGSSSRFVEKDSFVSRVIFSSIRSIIKGPRRKLRRISEKNYPIATFDGPDQIVRVNDVLPFRVKFINTGFKNYGPNNPPPIGVQVIGQNNYIL